MYVFPRGIDKVFHPCILLESPGCMAFRKCVFEKSYPFPDHIEMHDWWIGLVAECMGNTVFIYEPYLKYRTHGDNASSLHHHPLKKMIFNRLYFIEQLMIRWIQVGWHA